MGGGPEFNHFLEEATTERTDIIEQEISEQMQDSLLSNDKTKKMTYSLSANEEKDIFNITIGNLSGKKDNIEINGTHDSVKAVNTYMLQILTKDIVISLPVSSFPGSTQEHVIALEEKVKETLKRITN